MPIYEYECLKCHRVQEVLQKFSDRPLSKCKHCSGKLQKLISHNSFHLKGTGWYVTDYAQKSKGASSGSDTHIKTPASKDSTSQTDTKKSKESAD